jgi:geranylgeranyl diphosphate synthase type I
VHVTVDLDAELARLGRLTDGWIREAIGKHVSHRAERLAKMLDYHLGWRGTDLQMLATPAPAGKKLRPALVLLVANGTCADLPPEACTAAAAVELIHNFSLVHDDIQDHSELRRHRPTVWSLWGAAQGINVGDAFFALAQLVLVHPRTELSSRLAAELNATCLRLAEGQFLDIELQLGRTAPNLETYESMVARKTGVLFACACRMGAMAASASAATCDAYAAFGLELGIAFQEQDDLLGVWGRAAETGKPDAADIFERKRGLPAALALSRPEAPEWLRRAYAEQDAPLPADVAARVIAHFDTLDLQAVIERRVHARFKRALDYLDAAGAREPARSYLEAICEALVSRRT